MTGKKPALCQRGLAEAAEGMTSAAAADFARSLALWREEPLREAAPWPFAQTAVMRLSYQHRTARTGLAVMRFTAGRQREVISGTLSR
jgi:hypothetical protein